MNDLHKALGDISSIRRQMARSTEFRGYGPMTLAVTGATAMAAAGAPAFWLLAPLHNIPDYPAISLAAAVLSAALVGTKMDARRGRIQSGMAAEMMRMRAEQVLP